MSVNSFHYLIYAWRKVSNALKKSSSLARATYVLQNKTAQYRQQIWQLYDSMQISARQLLVKCSVDYRSDYLILTRVVIIIFKAWRHSFLGGGGGYFFLLVLVPDPCTALKKNRFFSFSFYWKIRGTVYLVAEIHFRFFYVPHARSPSLSTKFKKVVAG